MAIIHPAFAESPHFRDISQKIERISSGLVGHMGVAAQEIGTETRIKLNGDEAFVMASTLKVAVAVTLLDLVDQGQIKLSDLIDISPEMMVAGPNPIVQNFVHPGLKLSIANLIEVMITESDNTAADICLKLAGGPAAVTKKLRSIGILEQRIHRYGVELLQDFCGLPTRGHASAVVEAVTKDPTLLARIPNRNIEFEIDPRDQTTPNAMLDLLLAIDSGEVLGNKSREFLLASMSRTRTGGARLKGLLPRGALVAHKTGTLGGVANDVGFITLPDGRRFAIAVFTKSSATPKGDRERAIAEVSRTIYDNYYLE